MMDDLANRIRRAYPSGLLYELDEAALRSDERDERIKNVIRAVSGACSLNATIDPFTKPAYAITFTQKNHPIFEQWAWQMSNPDKLTWIAANGGEPYPVFWLKISRVADYYCFFYNHWMPRGDSGYVDAECGHEPNDLWKRHERRICDELDRNGFAYLTVELAREKVPFVLEFDDASIPDDDPRWNEDDFEPPLVPTSIHACLFSY